MVVAEGDTPLLVSCAVMVGEAGSSISRVLILDSTDWEEAPRLLGGTVRRNGGGELGWLR